MRPPDDTPNTPDPPVSRWRQVGTVVLFALAVLSLLGPWTLRAIGNWLVISDELERADAIFVHGGHLPFREIEAAGLWSDGWAPEVWIAPLGATPASEALAELGVEMPPSAHWRREALVAAGVDASAVRLLPDEVLTTGDEVEAVLAAMDRVGARAVILVSSKQHTRRIRWLWDAQAGEGRSAIVRPSEADPLDPDRWWANTDHAQAVLHELAALVDVLLGLGMRPDEG